MALLEGARRDERREPRDVEVLGAAGLDGGVGVGHGGVSWDTAGKRGKEETARRASVRASPGGGGNSVTLGPANAEPIKKRGAEGHGRSVGRAGPQARARSRGGRARGAAAPCGRAPPDRNFCRSGRVL
ncbi:5-formyltetrahydrofolate cyclo-ligase [Deinococcus gobiensis I-0]|uniref:5-formyltetrahydrofolate cyclo-ligase n=1 Tax=Deinococcus gobiensis (strain DSM 21396 / JCM 16679 / CGMCC 1.7299 / I-0) TaxID=745776 RepID=H8GWJ0_DEIGI|nr:5-formyltetrahydrofolate cyclo-ligase [Deinococcus gobiensis I-0]